MRIAGLLPLLLLCAPAAAGAQVQGPEAVEMKCVYAALSEAERAMLARVDAGRGAAGEFDQANDLIQREAEVCAQRHGWDSRRLLAAGGFAIARAIYEDKLATLPASLSAASLDAAAVTLSDEDRYRLTSAGRTELGVDPASSRRVEAALAAAGVTAADMDAAVAYLRTYHDGLFAMQVFHELWVEANP